MGCCDSYFDLEDYNEAASAERRCSDCGGFVNEEGFSVEEGCWYSTIECRKCEWTPCDESCQEGN